MAGANYRQIDIDRFNFELQRDVMVAVQCGYVEILKSVRNKMKSFPKFNFNFKYTVNSINGGKPKQFTPLLYACKCNQVKVVKWLIGLPDIEKNCKTEAKETPLILAVSRNNEEIIEELLVHGDQCLGERNKYKLTALHVACLKGFAKLAESLLRLNNAWISQGKTPPKVIQKKELKDRNGNTPFIMAVKAKHYNIVDMWLELEKEPSMILRPVCEDRNERGHTAVMVAAQTGQLDCLKKMADCNAISDDISTIETKGGWNIIHCAVASGKIEILEWVLSWKDGVLKNVKLLNAPNEKGYTPFLYACEYHHYEIAKFLLDLKDDKDCSLITIDGKTKNGMTGLHLAAQHDAVDIADLILNSYPDIVFERDCEHGSTVLHITASKSSTRVEERLKQDTEEYKQLKTIKNNDGKTPEDIRDPVHIPLEIRKRGAASIEAYRNALSKGKSCNNQCNLIVLGEARVGKTSLIRNILGMKFLPECKSTRGVVDDQIEFAEQVVIQVPSNSRSTPTAPHATPTTHTVGTNSVEAWKHVERLDQVKEKYADTIAQEVNEVTPKETNDAPEEFFHRKGCNELNRSIERVIRRLQAIANAQRTQQPPTHRRKQFDDSEHHSTEDPLEQDTRHHQPSPPPPEVSNPPPTKPAPVPVPKPDPVKPSGKPKIPKAVHKPESTVLMLDETKSITPPPDIKSTTENTPLHRRESVPYSYSQAIGKKLRKKRQPNQDLTFRTMDFAGQALYRPMHHCFITNRAVYVVVFKLPVVLKHIKSPAPGEDDPVVEIRYWLNNIIAHAGSNEDTADEEHPRIFLVGTHKNGDPKTGLDAVSDEDLKLIEERLFSIFIEDKKEYRYASFIYRMPDSSKILFCLENSCERTNSGVVELMQNIRLLKGKLSFLTEEFPISYLKFEEKLLQMKKKRADQPLMTTREEVERWARECGIEDQSGINTAIQYFHDIRVIVDQTLISSPFQVSSQQMSGSDSDRMSLVLLDPHWIGTVMSNLVEIDIKTNHKELSQSVVKPLKHYGIIHRDDLIKILQLGKATLTSKEATPSSLEATPSSLEATPSSLEATPSSLECTNVLKVLESYCLAYLLSSLQYKLLWIRSQSDRRSDKPEDGIGTYYLIPSLLPLISENKDCPTFGDDASFKFEFDFCSYLPTEVYNHTVCFFLSILKDLRDDEQMIVDPCTEYVVLTRSWSKFFFVQLESLPKAHWMIKMDQNTHTLKFSIISLTPDCPDDPSQFIVAVADLILRKVCIDGSLGHLQYKGGLRTDCQKCCKEVLFPFITSSKQTTFDKNADVICSNCRTGRKVNEILSKMVTKQPQVEEGTKTVYANSTDDNQAAIGIIVLKRHYVELVEAVSKHPNKFADYLWANDFISAATKNDIITTSGESSYTKGSKIMNEVSSILSRSHKDDQKKQLLKFCDVLRKIDDPLLKNICDEIIKELK